MELVLESHDHARRRVAVGCIAPNPPAVVEDTDLPRELSLNCLVAFASQDDGRCSVCSAKLNIDTHMRYTKTPFKTMIYGPLSTTGPYSTSQGEFWPAGVRGFELQRHLLLDHRGEPCFH